MVSGSPVVSCSRMGEPVNTVVHVLCTFFMVEFLWSVVVLSGSCSMFCMCAHS